METNNVFWIFFQTLKEIETNPGATLRPTGK